MSSSNPGPAMSGFERRVRFPNVMGLLASGVSLLHLLDVLLGTSSAGPFPLERITVATMTAAAGLLLAWYGSLALLLTTIGLLVGQFYVCFFYSSWSSSPRLLVLATLLSYGAALLILLLAGSRLLSAAKATLFAGSLAVALLVGESFLQLLPGPATPKGETTHSADKPSPLVETWPRWWGDGVEPHPDLGMVYKPHATLRTYYPDNPRKYFRVERRLGQSDLSSWYLNRHVGRQARLHRLDVPKPLMRVDQMQGVPGTDWELQLNFDWFELKVGKRYEFTFRGRADQNRTLAVAASFAHDPWTSVGLYEQVALTSDWQVFTFPFSPSESTKNARLNVDFGASNIPFELADAVLHPLDYSAAETPPMYSVEYRINSRGFRDRERSLIPPKDSCRILCLGDSFVMGIGVHHEDIFTVRLESLLNEGKQPRSASPKFEVLNCAGSGYATREQRLCYELYAHEYQAKVVLLVMVENDDISWLEQMKRRAEKKKQAIHQLTKAWALAENIHEQATPDFSVCAEELSKLKIQCDLQGAKLGVVLFPLYASPRYFALKAAVTPEAERLKIPVLDLADTLLNNRTELLIVHDVDHHPNEFAHGLATQEIYHFLRRESMLPRRLDGENSGKGSGP